MLQKFKRANKKFVERVQEQENVFVQRKIMTEQFAVPQKSFVNKFGRMGLKYS